MSSVTTEPELLTFLPSSPGGWLSAEAPDEYPGESTAIDGGRPERRRNGGSGDSPRDVLMRLPAVVILQRIPIPALAMTRDGTIVFANTAFADMVGFQQDSLPGLAFPQSFDSVPAALCTLSDVDAFSNLVVELRHRAGWMVRARMSKSALKRRDDPVVLVTFEDMTERLWMDEQ